MQVDKRTNGLIILGHMLQRLYSADNISPLGEFHITTHRTTMMVRTSYSIDDVTLFVTVRIVLMNPSGWKVTIDSEQRYMASLSDRRKRIDKFFERLFKDVDGNRSTTPPGIELPEGTEQKTTT